MRITKIETQKRRPDRKNIFVDGKFLTGVSDETLMRAGLRKGDTIDPATLDALQRTEGLLSAKNAALRFLSVRPRTVREVHDKLREKEYSDAEIESAIADLTRAGLLDDQVFARMFVRNAMQVRPIGKLLLKRKMLLLGIDKKIVDETLAETLGEVDQSEVALATAKKFISKSISKARTDVLKERKRVAGYLARRGFTWEVIGPTINTLLPIHDHSTEME